jgi:hypothetical protein
MKKAFEFSKKIVSSIVIASFVCMSVPCGSAFSSPIQNLQQNIKQGSTSSGGSAVTAPKKNGYKVTKVKAARKSKSKAAKSRPGSGSVGDAAYESSSGGSVAMKAGSNNSLTSRIVSGIRGLIGSTAFRGSDVKGGKVACAKVVSAALKKAGVIDRVILGVPDLVSEVKKKGFKEVKAPPFQAGDIVTWRTYDRNRDGKKDNDTHIGIVDSNGQAISNSSSRKMPRRHAVNYAPICRVLRAA